MGNTTLLIVIAAVMFAVIGGITLASHLYNLNGIKSKTVGDGQHGTARFATKTEIRRTYRQVPFTPSAWRRQAKKNQPPKLPQGIIVGCKNKGGETIALVDDADVHCMMVGAVVCGSGAVCRRSGYGKRYEYGAVPAQFFFGHRDGAGAVL